MSDSGEEVEQRILFLKGKRMTALWNVVVNCEDIRETKEQKTDSGMLPR